MDSAAQIALTVVGIIGLSGIVTMVKGSRRLSRHYRFFRFRQVEPVDFVLTTSAVTQGGFGIEYKRSVTAVGNMRAAIEVAQVIGYGSRRRPIRTAVSADIETPLDGDLVVIGLPGKNRASGLVLEHLKDKHPEIELEVSESEDGGCGLSLGGWSSTYEVKLQKDCEAPESDLALIVFWVNPLAVRKRRLILCAGFTAFGTTAAASYLVNQVLDDRIDRLREEHHALPALWSREWTCFAMAIEVMLLNDQAIDVRERAFVPLPDPGIPPFSAPEASRLEPLRTPQPVITQVAAE